MATHVKLVQTGLYRSLGKYHKDFGGEAIFKEHCLRVCMLHVDFVDLHVQRKGYVYIKTNSKQTNNLFCRFWEKVVVYCISRSSYIPSRGVTVFACTQSECMRPGASETLNMHGLRTDNAPLSTYHL